MRKTRLCFDLLRSYLYCSHSLCLPRAVQPRWESAVKRLLQLTIMRKSNSRLQDVGFVPSHWAIVASLKYVVVVVITPPRDGGTARMAIQAHPVNLIKLGKGKVGSPF